MRIYAISSSGLTKSSILEQDSGLGGCPRKFSLGVRLLADETPNTNSRLVPGGILSINRARVRWLAPLRLPRSIA